MDARLYILSDELCQVNTRVSLIAKWKARLAGFVEFPFPSLEASKDEDDNGDSGSDADATANEDASSSSDNEITAS